jgi:histidyl-tRNA synthetase
METKTETEKPITLEFTKDEIGFLNECLDTIQEYHFTLQTPDVVPEDVAIFESIEAKVIGAYKDNCVKYNLSPVILEYNKKYGTWGTGEDAERWQKFKDNYDMLTELGFIT